MDDLIPSQALMLLTDFYQLTMALGYWKKGLDKREAVFHLFFRRNPFKGGFTIAAGLERVIDFVRNFQFTPSDLAYLETIKGQNGEPIFSAAFLDYLSTLRFTGSLDAIAEGSVVFPYEPLIRVQGPLIECQLLESILLNLVNFPTLIATKAARICLAAGHDSVLEFGMRRAQGIDGALTASRAAYIGGCEATSNVLAGKLFGIPVRGTQAHSWIMIFANEEEAFEAYAEQIPGNPVFLVDTYNTIEGVKKAIHIGKKLKDKGKKLLGIRLDSGDLADLSIKSRKMLDAAGFQDTLIMASNELDETVISELKKQGAKITSWGVGTNLVTGKEQPALDGVYKLSAIRNEQGAWKYKIKLSEQMVKISNPGILQVRRYYTQDGPVVDVLYDTETPLEKTVRSVDPLDSTHIRQISEKTPFEDLLEPIFKNGVCVYNLPSLEEIRNKTKKNLEQFPFNIKRYLNPQKYPVCMHEELYNKKVALIQKIRYPQYASE